MMRLIFTLAVALALASCHSLADERNAKLHIVNSGSPLTSAEAGSDLISDSDVSSYNKLVPYLMLDEAARANSIKPMGEREGVITPESPNGGAPTVNNGGRTTLGDDDDDVLSPAYLESLRSISMQNREVRLVPPNNQEVDMKKDLQTRLLVVWDNLQKEATTAWGKVNKTLDKSWTDFKTMIERAVGDKKAVNSRQLRDLLQGKPDSSLIVAMRDSDGYAISSDDESMADSPASSSGDGSAGARFKSILSSIGIDENSQRKAGDALSKAGTSVSDTMTKDLPDALKKAGDAVSETMTKDFPVALKKAGDAVSETVTKDIPNAFKNWFG